MATATKNGKGKLPDSPGEVLTLAETAQYLRILEADVLEAVKNQRLPGRKVGNEWRFLKIAVEQWLRDGTAPRFWETHFGALSKDPFLAPMLEQIYEQRGRSKTG